MPSEMSPSGELPNAHCPAHRATRFRRRTDTAQPTGHEQRSRGGLKEAQSARIPRKEAQQAERSPWRRVGAVGAAVAFFLTGFCIRELWAPNAGWNAELQEVTSRLIDIFDVDH